MFPGIDKREEAHHITLQSCDPLCWSTLALMGLISVAGRYSTISQRETEVVMGNTGKEGGGRGRGQKREEGMPK